MLIAHLLSIIYINAELVTVQANNKQGEGVINMEQDTVGWSLDRTAHELGVSNNTLVTYIKTGRVPYIRIGRKYIFSAEEIRRFLRGEYQPSAAPGKEPDAIPKR